MSTYTDPRELFVVPHGTGASVSDMIHAIISTSLSYPTDRRRRSLVEVLPLVVGVAVDGVVDDLVADDALSPDEREWTEDYLHFTLRPRYQQLVLAIIKPKVSMATSADYEQRVAEAMALWVKLYNRAYIDLIEALDAERQVWIDQKRQLPPRLLPPPSSEAPPGLG